MPGWLRTGQGAHRILGAPEFNQTGGPNRFNRPCGAASDGRRLFLADRNHNRVLIWNFPPDAGAPPDLVLGQPDFQSCEPGSGPEGLNWPVSVSTGRGRLVVADTLNDRLLLWNAIPTRSGQPADLALAGLTRPWGAWTDGRRVLASVTGEGRLHLWESWPERPDQPADLLIEAGGQMVEPRTLTTNGAWLMVGDTRSNSGRGPVGNFVWRALPGVAGRVHDYFLNDPLDPGVWMQGEALPDGRLVVVGSTLHVWDALPAGEADRPILSLTGKPLRGGPGADVALVAQRVYVSLPGEDRVVGFRTVPTQSNQRPDFILGARGMAPRTYDPLLATNERILVLASAKDRRLQVWRSLPQRSGTPADQVLDIPFSPRAIAMRGDALVVAAAGEVRMWPRFLEDERAVEVRSGMVGTVKVDDVRGVALAEGLFCLSDAGAGKVYGWSRFPRAGEPPQWTLPVGRPGPLSADDRSVLVTPLAGQTVLHYRRTPSGIAPRPEFIGGGGVFRQPATVLAAGGHLFVADAGSSRVHCWRRAEDAAAGIRADAVLGGERPGIGQACLLEPGTLAWDGTGLWVGEHGASDRVLRFATDGG